MQLPVNNTICIRLLNPSDLFIDKTHQRLLNLIAGSIFRQFALKRIFNLLRYLSYFQQIIQHQQRIVISVSARILLPHKSSHRSSLGSNRQSP